MTALASRGAKLGVGLDGEACAQDEEGKQWRTRQEEEGQGLLAIKVLLGQIAAPIDASRAHALPPAGGHCVTEIKECQNSIARMCLSPRACISPRLPIRLHPGLFPYCPLSCSCARTSSSCAHNDSKLAHLGALVLTDERPPAGSLFGPSAWSMNRKPPQTKFPLFCLLSARQTTRPSPMRTVANFQSDKSVSP